MTSEQRKARSGQKQAQIRTYWKWDKARYKVHCTPVQASQIAKWKGCTRDAAYFYPCGRMEWDVLIPHKLLARALKVLEE